MTNVIPVYCIPTTVQQAGLDTAQCLAPQEHPGPPQMPPPAVMLPGQQPTFIPQQGKKNINDKFLKIHCYPLTFLLPAMDLN
jgi:hypothetical protein